MVLLEIGEKAGVHLKERDLRTEDLYGADEVFITSTTREVQPVSEIEEHKIAQVDGPVTRLLAEAFFHHVAETIQKMNFTSAG